LISDTSESAASASGCRLVQKTLQRAHFSDPAIAAQGSAFGMIYADKAELGGLQVDEKELAMLRTLRNQAVMAFRQAG
jgi:hypothetical protein